MTNFDFLKTAAKDFRVGALTVSSKYVVKKIRRELPRGVRNILEYGAGDGAITKGLLESLPADGRLVAVELNPQLAEELRNTRDPRLTVVNDDVVHIARDLRSIGLSHIDCVVSGIPLSFLNRRAREEVVQSTYEVLRTGGRCIIYQHSLLMAPVIRKFFKTLRTRFELRNFLPYFIMIAEKRE